jgi:predicted TPR repeat methyltransferase
MRFSSSGDVLADKRYAYARQYRAAGDHQAAADLFAQAVELAPAWAAGWFALGESREAAGDATGAAEAFARALELDPDDAHGVAPRLAVLRGETPSGLPAGYVRALFDDYAPRFDSHLTVELDYRAPALIVDALDRLAPGRRFSLALDLGCGTGLMGAAVRDRTLRLEGVDLSPVMVAEAARRGVYDAVEAGDLVAWLRTRRGADLVLAADVLVYLGNLAPLFAAVAGALSQGGLFAFTVETHGDDGFVLGRSLRYAHCQSYLRERAADAELAVRLLEPAVTRRDAGEDVPGLLAVLARA